MAHFMGIQRRPNSLTRFAAKPRLQPGGGLAKRGAALRTFSQDWGGAEGRDGR
jgi:hypothetical protein